MKRVVLGFILAQMSLSAFCAPQTLRIDYYHTGNSETEIFSLDQVVLEPLPFPATCSSP